MAYLLIALSLASIVASYKIIAEAFRIFNSEGVEGDNEARLSQQAARRFEARWIPEKRKRRQRRFQPPKIFFKKALLKD